MLHYWCCIFIFSSLVLAQPPNNNLCSTAVTISYLPFTYNGATTGASKEHICNLYNAGDVWFSFFPTYNDYVRVDLCSANYDSVIYIVPGSCASYTCIVIVCWKKKTKH